MNGQTKAIHPYDFLSWWDGTFARLFPFNIKTVLCMLCVINFFERFQDLTANIITNYFFPFWLFESRTPVWEQAAQNAWANIYLLVSRKHYAFFIAPIPKFIEDFNKTSNHWFWRNPHQGPWRLFPICLRLCLCWKGDMHRCFLLVD